MFEILATPQNTPKITRAYVCVKISEYPLPPPPPPHNPRRQFGPNIIISSIFDEVSHAIKKKSCGKITTVRGPTG